MTKEDLIELFSISRLNAYTNLGEHEQNLLLISQISCKLGMIEIIIRNRIDKTMSKRDDKWLYNIPAQIVLDDDNGKITEHDTLVSRQTFGFWLKIAREYKIENFAFDNEFLRSFSFKKYSKINKDKAGKDPLMYWQKASLLLEMLRNIRNRAFHFEKLLKINSNGTPRLNAKVNFKNSPAIISIDPNKIVGFVDDILSGFNKNLLNYAKWGDVSPEIRCDYSKIK